MGDVPGLKDLVPGHHQQVEGRLPAVAQKQVLADEDVKRPVDLHAVGHGHRRRVVRAHVVDSEPVEQVVHLHLPLKASLAALRPSMIELHRLSLHAQGGMRPGSLHYSPHRAL